MDDWVVFDFDRTLIERDTLFGFYRAASEPGFLFQLKRIILTGVAVLYKLRLINNDALKSAGIWLFLRNKSVEELEQAAEAYAASLSLNEIYQRDFLQTAAHRRVVVSASPELYLRRVFEGETVFGSQLKVRKGRVVGLMRNLYGPEKVRRLLEEGIVPISAVFTDSYSDKPLMELAETVWLVEKGQKKIIKEKNLSR